jgi:hypothetical protein
MRDRLQAAAAKARRSISEEIEHRLEQSFTEDHLSAIFLGGGDTATALRLIADAMRLETAAGEGTPWSENREKAEAVRTAAHLIIAGMTGLPAIPPPIEHFDAVTQLRPSERGRELARFLLERSNLKLPTDSHQEENRK